MPELSRLVAITSSEGFRNATKKGTVAVYYTADWCQPCKVQKKALEVYFKSPIPNVQIAMVDVETDLPEADHVVSIPFWELFVDGDKVNEYDTYLDPQGLRDFIEQARTYKDEEQPQEE